ncbi:MAG TPA: class I SAM-dependent methyltransferase [Acidimicrobiales bacterium]|nr:class I SAM-dependent methyltransferase [Acidimicrobiales bacterium]
MTSTQGTRLAEMEDWHFWFVGRDELVVALLDRLAPSGLLVDVGCGTGAFAARLAEERATPVVALDHACPARSGAAAAALADAERLPLRDGAAAVVLARDVLEHVDDGVALAECRRVLRPDGMLVALVPAWPRLWSERDVGAGHRRRYTRPSLRRVLSGAGFRVHELRGYQLALLPALALSRAASRWRPTSLLRAEVSPPRRLNAALGAVNRAEAGLARRRWLRPPVGSTLAVVAVPR